MSNPLDFFKEIYCITLSPEGKSHALSQSKRIGISQRVKFYDPPSFNEFDLEDSLRTEARIFYSYRHILEKAYKEGNSNVMIFLDSVAFVDFPALSEGIKDLSQYFRLSRGMHWEIILFGTEPRDNLVKITDRLLHVIRGCSVYCAGFNHTFIYPFIEMVGSSKEDILKVMRETGVRFNTLEDWLQRYKFALNLVCVNPISACVNPKIYHRQCESIQEQKDSFNFFCRQSISKTI